MLSGMDLPDWPDWIGLVLDVAPAYARHVAVGARIVGARAEVTR
ncbi:hypothetical protein QTQ03_25185 [Micromonospora sp. WMMA1363]|nr:hypothetical protein [Micromonospora sp. WMMA1363]MDM4722729.1 hypothetical protein [Micromonospora sp. WMMA1363]